MEEQLPKIGDEFNEASPPPVFELVLDDHVLSVDPNDYGLDEKFINPNDYFITSGDAVEKARILRKDLYNLVTKLYEKSCVIIAKENSCSFLEAEELYKSGVRPKRPAKLKEFVLAVTTAADQSDRLLCALQKAKGSNIFLETEWDSHHLLCIPKNPRKAL